MALIDKHAPGSFCWMELGAADQAAAKSFYTSLLGWTFTEFPMGPGELYTIFRLQDRDVAGAYALNQEMRARGVPPHWMIYVAVQSADEAAARAGQLGGKVVNGPFDVMDAGRMAVLQDPTGAMFSIWQAGRSPGIGIAGEFGSFCWADLSTPDVDRAKDFYSGLFGWKIAPGENDPSGYLHIQNGEQMIGGIPPASMRNPGVPPHWLIYYYVADVDASAAQAKSLGASLLLPPMSIEHVGRMSVIRDPQGAAFAVFKDTPKG